MRRFRFPKWQVTSDGRIIEKETRRPEMNTFFQSIPTTEGVRKVGPGEGEQFNIAGAHLTWKVKGEDSGYAFSICEQTLAPGEGVPLHCHPSAEVFYILSGAADFFRLVDGEEDWIRCETGDLMILPPNSLHAFYNKSSEPCSFLGISTQLHQAFFDAVANRTKTDRSCLFRSRRR
jgi:quercetin dioxygenase-like cupin family protein